MAMVIQPGNARNQPSISREAYHSATRKLADQYVCGHKADEILPKAVFIKHLPSYDEFFSNFLLRNQLCILSKEATKEWRSRRDWVEEDGSPNIDFLLQAFGEATVPVADCKKREFSGHVKQEMLMCEFLAYWKQSQEASQGMCSHPDSLYLKDWHFTRAFPDYEAYSTVSFFRSDWMNEFWDVRDDINDDYRFVYMGPKGTWTPFHADVFRSFSWSANICGRKKWIIYPPGEEEFLKDIHGKLVYDVTSQELEDRWTFCNAHKAKNRIELIQNPGETVFVPSGWHHQVHNLDDTISINHNWLNGCNVRLCWNHLKDALMDVQKEISDCIDMDGWENQCQLILRAYTGLNYIEFFNFMESIAQRRQTALDHCSQSGIPSPHLSTTETSVGRDRPVDYDRSQSQSDGNQNSETDTQITNMSRESELASFVSLSEVASPVSEYAKDGTQITGTCVCQCADINQAEPCSGKRECYKNEETNHNNLGLKSFSGEKENDETNSLANSPSVSIESVQYTLDRLLSCLQNTDIPNTPGVPSRSTEVLCNSDVSSINPHVHAATCAVYKMVNLDAKHSILNLYEISPKGRTPNEPHWARCNVNHALFDLVSVFLVVRDMVKNTDIEALLPTESAGRPRALLKSVTKTLQKFGVNGGWCSMV